MILTEIKVDHLPALIPDELRQRWETRTARRTMLKLENMLDLRELIEDCEVKGERYIMRLYDEAAGIFRVTPDAVRNDIATIRKYSADNLKRWVSAGLGFSHLETANRLQYKAKKTALQLLDECIAYGDEHGRVMTVKKLEAHALGEQIVKPTHDKVNWVLRSLGNFPTLFGWDDDRSARFQTWMDAGREFWS